MVEKKASERLDEILIEERDSIRREDLLIYIRSNFEGLSLSNRVTPRGYFTITRRNSRSFRR